MPTQGGRPKPTPKKPKPAPKKKGVHVSKATPAKYAEFLSGKKGNSLVLVHNMQMCIHCQMMEADWKAATPKLLAAGVNVVEIHSAETYASPALRKAMDPIEVNGVPTVFKVTGTSGKKTLFQQPRTSENFAAFMRI